MDLSPKRGHYDRTLGAEERRKRAYERTVAATIAARAEHGLSATVDHVLAAARIGRSTFYAHFHDLDAALVAVASRVHERTRAVVAQAVAAHTTPIERFASLPDALALLHREEPALIAAALVPDQRDATPLARSITRCLAPLFDAAERAGAIAPNTTLRRRVASALLVELCRALRDARDDVESPAAARDLLVRIVR